MLYLLTLRPLGERVCEDSGTDLVSLVVSEAPNMMPAVNGMSHMVPNHVLRVGQTVRLESAQETVTQHPGLTESSSCHSDPDLDISLDNLNQLILDLDPTFEPIPLNKSPSYISPPTGTVPQKYKYSKFSTV